MTDLGTKILVVYRYNENTADGGGTYERALLDTLHESIIVEGHAIVTGGGKLAAYLRTPIEVRRFSRALRSRADYPVIIETMDASLMPVRRPQKRIVVVHHLGFSRDRVYSLFENLMLRRVKSADCIVTVSRFWQSRLSGLGFPNVKVIYNAFALEEFEFEPGEVERFLKCYDLGGKPIVYVGNQGTHKGSAQSAQCLRDLDVHLVGSGDSGSGCSGARMLRLHRKDYLRLLRASTVAITMSQFDEGWCRTAHEAMLCGTPVIGSGRGGMGELLNGSGQIVCRNFESLRDCTIKMLSDPARRTALGASGKAFAMCFGTKRFCDEWATLITNMSITAPRRASSI